MPWVENFLKINKCAKGEGRLFETLEQASNMQNIHSLKEVFKDKKIVGLPWWILWPQSTLVHCITFPSNKN